MSRPRLPAFALVLSSSLLGCSVADAGSAPALDSSSSLPDTRAQDDAEADTTDSIAPDTGVADSAAVDASDGGVLVPTSATYRNTCDGSGAVWVDATHFLDFSDEDQILRIYTQGVSSTPVQTTEISTALGLTATDEADLEDAARVGNRAYGITSHDLTAEAGAAPEAIVPYPGTKDVQILFDRGDANVDGGACKDATTSKQTFYDVIVHVP